MANMSFNYMYPYRYTLKGYKTRRDGYSNVIGGYNLRTTTEHILLTDMRKNSKRPTCENVLSPTNAK